MNTSTHLHIPTEETPHLWMGLYARGLRTQVNEYILKEYVKHHVAIKEEEFIYQMALFYANKMSFQHLFERDGYHA